MRIKFTSVLCAALLNALIANVCPAQTKNASSVTFQQGGWTKADDPLSPFICQCNGGADCICSMIAYCGTCKTGTPNTFTLAVRSQRVVGNSLNVTFATAPGTATGSGIPPSVKHTDFTQKDEVKLDAAAAAALGYAEITILPGKYSLKNNSLVLNIKRGKPLPFKR
jgi:hypothetical protein